MPLVVRASSANTLAQRFHETYERLAPSFGYETRRASAKPWAEVPEQNRNLMIAVCATLGGGEQMDELLNQLATANAARSRALKALETWEEKLHDAEQDIQEIAARITASNPFVGTAQVPDQEDVPVVAGNGWNTEQEQDEVL